MIKEVKLQTNFTYLKSILKQASKNGISKKPLLILDFLKNTKSLDFDKSKYESIEELISMTRDSIMLFQEYNNAAKELIIQITEEDESIKGVIRKINDELRVACDFFMVPLIKVDD
jgi:hypothetical protein